MALPDIAPYSMPAPASLPTGRVAWDVDPDRAVLLVHDLQNYFLDAFTPDASPVSELLRNVKALTDACRRAGIPVVYSAQPGGQTPAERGLQQDFWGPGLPADARAAAVHEAVAPAEGDTVLTKWKYSAFVRTDLERRMRDQGRDQLLITGVYAHIGVLMSACDAWMRDLRAFVIADAVADFSERDHRMALEWAAGKCAVVTTASRVLDALGDDPAPGAAGNTSAWTAERVRADVAAVLGDPPEDVPLDESLIDYGLDSIRLMTLVERWREEGAVVSITDFADRVTVRAWADVLAGARR